MKDGHKGNDCLIEFGHLKKNENLKNGLAIYPFQKSHNCWAEHTNQFSSTLTEWAYAYFDMANDINLQNILILSCIM
jgi:hypothetical protein